MASTELVTLEQVEDVLLHGGNMPVVESDQIQDDIVQQILASKSLEEAFGEFSATSAKDIEGVLVDVRGLAWVKSTFEEGPGVYALCDCKLVESGLEVRVSMGGKTTMARFIYAMRNNAMPIRGVFQYEETSNGSGRRFLTFKLAPKTVKSS